MVIDLVIGFLRQPENLEPYVFEQGFQLESTEQLPEWILHSKYRLFIDKKSAQGVWLSFYDGLNQEDRQLWETIAPQTPIVATAIARVYSGYNWFDFHNQHQVSAALRDRYAALLYDFQAARFVYHKDHIQEELAMVRHPIDYRDWYASQWSRTSVAIFTSDQHEPLRIIERPEEWGDNWAWNLYDQGVYLKRTP